VASALARRRGRALGVAVGSPDALDVAARVDALVLDAAGTVTTGSLRVVAVHPVDPEHDRSVRWFAAALAHTSDSPVDRAVAQLATRGRVTDVVATPGIGLSGSVDKHPVRLGRPDWVGLAPVDGIGTTVGVEVDGRPLGRLVVADVVRDHAAEAVDALAADGVRVELVSAGRAVDTAHVAEQSGVEHWHAEAGDAERAGVVEQLRASGRVTGHAGSVPVAGADVMLGPDGSGADLVLDDLDVRRVADVLRLARWTVALRTRLRTLAWVVTPTLAVLTFLLVSLLR
jgi:P-type E1-E2 ATPase